MHNDNVKFLKRTIDYTEFASSSAYKTIDLLTLTSGVKILLSAWVIVVTRFKGSPDDYKALKVSIGRVSNAPPYQPDEFLSDSSVVGTGNKTTKGSDFAINFPTLTFTGTATRSVKIRLRDGDGDLGAGDLPLDHLSQGSLVVYLAYSDLED